ncbi:MAG: biotin/lipoyl-binding protein, partial [Proteobacteria bacterium]|nr:biotin/lipoyl-binding protein [Pseudomonadota bacterium]
MKLTIYQILTLILLFTPKYVASETTPYLIHACHLKSLLTVANSQVYAEVKSREQANIAAEISAKIVNITIEVGNKVMKGDILFSLDDRQWQLQLKQLIANIKGIKARHKLATYKLKQRIKLHKG